MSKVYTAVLKTIAPNQKEKEELEELSSTFLKKLNKELSGAQAILGGSAAKDTWLKENKDIDVFVQYDYEAFKTKSAELSQNLRKCLKKAFPKEKLDLMHGSRDYFQINYKGTLFEVVPILKIEKAGMALNITDISPLHAEWVNTHAKKLKNDIRLAKQFCKAQNLYGAESYISGFSGYILEILVIFYGGFENFLEAATKWKEGTVIDPSKFYKNKNMVLFELNSSKLQCPLVIVDPVDKHRNAAAALGVEKFKLLIAKAKMFLKNPSPEMFVFEKLSCESLASKKGHKVYLAFSALEGKKDVVGAKLLKVFTFLKKELEGYGINFAAWQWKAGDSAEYFFVLKKDDLGKEILRRGPPTNIKDHAALFKKRYTQAYEKEGVLYAMVRIREPKLEDRLDMILKKKYLAEKIAKVKKKQIL